MSDVMELKEIVEEFDKRFNILNDSLLMKFFEQEGLRLSYDFIEMERTKRAIIPPRDYVDSYVLTLRFFIQNNEKISLYNMHNLYKKYYKSKDLFVQFCVSRNTINNELKRKYPFRVNDKTISYKELFYGWIYGELAHSNKKRYKGLYEFVGNRFGYELAWVSFLNCIIMMHKNLFNINNLNKMAF